MPPNNIIDVSYVDVSEGIQFTNPLITIYLSF